MQSYVDVEYLISSLLHEFWMSGALLLILIKNKSLEL